MSVYTEISKRIGLTGDPLPIPTLKEAVKLRIGVASRSEKAFEQVFRYHRFCQSANNNDERAAQNELWAAWRTGCRLFK